MRKIPAAAWFVFVLGIVAVVLTGCEPTSPSMDQAQSDVANMRFIRHPNGLCFGVVRFMTSAMYMGTSITLVPSETCGPIGR